MKIKINSNVILSGLITIIILVDNCFFNLFKSKFIDFFMGTQNKRLVSVLVLVTAFFYVVIKKEKSFYQEISKFACKYICALIFFVLIEIVYTSLFFDLQPVYTTINQSLPFFIILLYFPLIRKLVNDRGTKKIFNILNIVALINYLLAFMQAYIYMESGHIFLNYDFIWIRNGRPRIGFGVWGGIMIIYNFYQGFFGKDFRKKTIKYIFIFLFGIIVLFLYQQTRAMTMAIILSMTTICLFGKKNMNKIIKSVAFIFIGSIFILGTGYINRVVDSIFELTSESTYNRTYAIEHYAQIFEKYPFFGTGFTTEEHYFSMIRGSLGIAYIDDVGIIGIATSLGMVGVFFVVVFVLRLSYIAYRLSLYRDPDASLFWACVVYLFATMPTLIIFNPQRIILVPILLSIFEYKYFEHNSICQDK